MGVSQNNKINNSNNQVCRPIHLLTNRGVPWVNLNELIHTLKLHKKYDLFTWDVLGVLNKSIIYVMGTYSEKSRVLSIR